MLLDALAVLRDSLSSASLTIVGDGPLRTHLEEQARTYRIADRIQFLGFRRDLPDLLASADIEVVPSRWEGFGLAAIEASACGLPIIASSVGGLQEAVVDQETGILITPEEPKLLADAMQALAADRPRRVLFGHAGRRHVERNFDIKRIAERYEEIYESFLRS